VERWLLRRPRPMTSPSGGALVTLRRKIVVTRETAPTLREDAAQRGSWRIRWWCTRDRDVDAPVQNSWSQRLAVEGILAAGGQPHLPCS